MAHTRAWSNSTPAGGDQLSGAAAEIRNLRTDVDERQTLEHYWGDSTTYDGCHIPGKASVIANQDTAATIVANGGAYLAAYNGSVAMASNTSVLYVKKGTINLTDGTWTPIVAQTTFWTASGATVFNTTMSVAATFQDLDLSATVGANSSLVFLEIKASAACFYIAKPKGYGGAYAVHQIASGDSSGSGAASVEFEISNGYTYMAMATNSSGVLQHACSSVSPTITVKLVGYIK